MKGFKQQFILIGVALSLVALSIMLWRMCVADQHHAISQVVERVAVEVQNELESRLESRNQALQRMADRWARRGGTPKAEWESDALSYVDHYKGYQAIEWVDPSFHVRWVVPLEGNEGVVGMASAFEPKRQKALEDARDNHTIAYTQPIDLIQGDKGFLVYVPIYVQDTFEGFVLGVYKATPLFDQILPKDRIAAGYGLRIVANNESIYERPVQNSDMSSEPCVAMYCCHQRSVAMGTVKLEIKVWPSDETLGRMHSILPLVVLFGCLSFSCLMILVCRSVLISWVKHNQLSQQLNQANENVNSEIDRREHAQIELERQIVAVESAFDGIAVLNSEGCYTYMNRSHAQIYGYDDPEDLYGCSWEVLYFPEEISTVREQIFAKLEQDGRWQGEMVGKKYSHERFHVEVSLTALPDGGMICICRDITERKTSEHAILESEGRLQGILDNTSAVVYMKDLKGRYLLINRQFENLFNVQNSKVTGKTDYDLFPQEMADAFTKNDKEVATAGRFTQFEETAPHADGLHSYVSVKFPMRDSSGHVYAVAGISTDITDLKKAEYALRESEQRFDLAIRGTQDGLWDWLRVDEEEEWWSPRFYELLGYQEGEIPATLSMFVDLLHPEDQDLVNEAIDVHFKENTPFDIEYRLRTKSGDYRWFRARGTSVRDDEGKPLRMAGSIQDIHDRKIAQEDLQRFALQLKNSNRELENFVHTVSHDLKSPLVTFMGFLSHLNQAVDAGDTESLPTFVEFLDRAAIRMRETINDLLEICTVGRVVQDQEQIDVHDLIQSVLGDYEDDLCIREIQICINGPMPEIYLDKTRLRQVFQNLIVNAIKYGCTGASPRIEIGSKTTDTDVAFYVKDNGPGVDPNQHKKIFGLFQRLASDTDGTGVGLAIVSRVAEFYQGRAWVESEPGHGATFWISFPLESVRHINYALADA